MGRNCSVFNCNGNYRGQPYTRVVKFPKDETIRNQWIDAMPNPQSQLEKKKDIYICCWHFECPFAPVQGGERPTGPPTKFIGIPKSCLKQTQSIPRKTTLTSSESRKKHQAELEKENDTIKSFLAFKNDFPKKYPDLNIQHIGLTEFTAFKTDMLGKKVIFFVHFQQEFHSPVGFLKLVCIEKNGLEIPKKSVDVPKNSLVHRWSQISSIFNSAFKYQSTNKDIFQKVSSLME